MSDIILGAPPVPSAFANALKLQVTWARSFFAEKMLGLLGAPGWWLANLTKSAAVPVTITGDTKNLVASAAVAKPGWELDDSYALQRQEEIWHFSTRAAADEVIDPEDFLFGWTVEGVWEAVVEPDLAVVVDTGNPVFGPGGNGNFYLVTKWSKSEGRYDGYPLEPSVEKAVWRRHNLFMDDVIETTQPMDGVPLLKEFRGSPVPANGIDNWIVSNNAGRHIEPKAYEHFQPNAHKVSNHCVGVLTYDDMQAIKYYANKEKDSTSLLKFQAAQDLKNVIAAMPLGYAFKDGTPLQSLDGSLLTAAKLAERFQTICPVPVPKVSEKYLEAGYEVLIEDRPAPLGTVEEVEANDPYKDCRDAKVPGWTPTNCYVGMVKDTQVTVTTAINWQNNADKHAMVFTTGSAYTVSAGCFNMKATGVLTGELNLRICAGDPTGAMVTLASGIINLAELPLANVWIWISLATSALANATVYTLELTTTATLDVANYITLYSNAAGGGAGNQRWLYTAGAWAAQGASRLGFATSDNTNMGTIRDSQTTVDTDYLWQNNADAHSHTFTSTVAAFNLGQWGLWIRKVGNPVGKLRFAFNSGASNAATQRWVATVNCSDISATGTWIQMPALALSFPYSAGGIGTVYSITVSTTATLNLVDYLILSGTAAGGAAGNQYWLYTGGAWAAQGANRLGFYVSSLNTWNGIYIVRADVNADSLLAAAGPKGLASNPVDRIIVTMGATLTRNADSLNARVWLGMALQYSTVTAQVSMYRYGFEVVNAGVSVRWVGSLEGAGCGWVFSPTSADASSKSLRCTFNGTSASPCVVSTAWTTAGGNTFTGDVAWTINWGYGSILGQWVEFKYPYYSTGALFTVSHSHSARTDGTFAININHGLVVGLYCSSSVQRFPHSVIVAAPDLPSVMQNWTMQTGASFAVNISPIWGGTYSGAIAGFYFRYRGMKFMTEVGGGGGASSNEVQYSFGMATRYIDGDTIWVTDVRFSEATPGSFTVIDPGTGGDLEFTVDNIASIAADDCLVIFNAGGTEIGRCTRAEYEAALYDKAANRYRKAGFVSGTTYLGLYAQYTRDSVLWGPASATDDGTPTAPAPAAEIIRSLKRRGVLA